jgi:hypothetical protein
MIFLGLTGIETRALILGAGGIAEASSTFLDIKPSINNGTKITAKAVNATAYIIVNFTATLINNTPSA